MATAVEEPIWTTEGARKRAMVQRMFSEIAPTYDLINGMMSLSLHRRWRSYAVGLLNLKKDDLALDVCCGTGDFMQQLRQAGARPLGIDFCEPMLVKAAEKVGAERLSVGDACQLPVASQCVDAVTVGWGIRNVPDIGAAHREICRVLKPGGRFVSIDMSRPRNAAVRKVSEFVFNTLVPRLGALFGKTQAYTYLPQSTQRFWTREQLAASMESAGMVEVSFRDLMFGNICVHHGRKPAPGEQRA